MRSPTKIAGALMLAGALLGSCGDDETSNEFDAARPQATGGTLDGPADLGATGGSNGMGAPSDAGRAAVPGDAGASGSSGQGDSGAADGAAPSSGAGAGGETATSGAGGADPTDPGGGGGNGGAGGTAAEPECEAGELACDELTPLVCEDGELVPADDDCAFVCTDGECSGDCEPESTRCNEGAFETCSDDYAWEETQTCAGECDDTDGCLPICEPGALRCTDDVLEECAEDGQSWELSEECEFGCGGEACLGCEPGSEQCVEGESLVELCDEEGSWQPQETCLGELIVCGPCEDGDGCNEDEDCESGYCSDEGICAEPPEAVTILAAGDIGDCDSEGDEATELLLAANEDASILVLGDLAYDDGSEQQFQNCFDPTFGQHLERMFPVPGNHEYIEPDAAAYFDYFGAVAGDPAEGYYSFDLGEWHIVALNSNCGEIDGGDGCDANSAQVDWLRADLENNPAECTLAFWHHPRFSTGFHGPETDVSPLWQALMDFDAEVVLSGHDHNYERWEPQTATGQVSDAGIVQFVVGTGGTELRALTYRPAHQNAVLRDNSTHGVLKMSLGAGEYSWEYLAVAGESFTDTGSAECH